MATGTDGNYTTYTDGSFIVPGTAIPVFLETLTNQTVTFTLSGIADTFSILSDAGANTVINQGNALADTLDIFANGGSVSLGTGISTLDSISITIENGGTFIGNGIVAGLLGSKSVEFAGGGGTLVVGTAGTFVTRVASATISGFAAGDTVDDLSLLFSGLSTYTISGTPGAHQTVQITDTQGDYTFSTDAAAGLPDGTYASTTGPLALTPDVNGGTQITLCFLAGTRIAVPGGETDVARLRIGDEVLTSDGACVPVRWIGVSSVATRFADPLRSMPVRIKAGAFAPDVPSRDLLVSPGHALFLDGVLVTAGALVNATTITREPSMPPAFVYYHLEVQGHALILAENTPAETFVDNIDRMRFDNWDEYLDLFGDAEPIAEMPYPRAKSARQIPGRVRARIAARVASVLGDIDAAA